MTKRGLIVGTSHSAALRLAWSSGAKDSPGMTLDFAAIHGNVSDFAVVDGEVTGANAKAIASLEAISGRARFALADYDFVALCSGTPNSFHAIRLYNTARWPGLPSQQGASLAANPPWALLSAACFAAALKGAMSTTNALIQLRSIKAVSPAALFLIPEPALFCDALAEKGRYNGFVTLQRNGDAAALGQMQRICTAALCADLATYLPPPDDLLINGFFTDPALRRGAKRLGPSDSIAQPKDDYLHGNAQFGHRMLQSLYQHLPG